VNISESQLTEIRRKFGSCASWAIWPTAYKKPREGVGNMSVFDFNTYPENRAILHSDYVLVALNFSVPLGKISEIEPFSNFHSPSPRANDFKMRRAFQDTPLWGAYMTDIIKWHPEVDSGKVRIHVRSNPDFMEKHYRIFNEELRILGTGKKTLVALGIFAYELLKKRYEASHEILRLHHYSHWISGENYTAHVAEQLVRHQNPRNSCA
jgi:hypothetical protein